jgi:hypothetical protein
MDPRASLEYAEKRKFFPLPGLEVRPLGRSVRSLSLYRLRYPDSCLRTGRALIKNTKTDWKKKYGTYIMNPQKHK